jgi:hypothetical protein
LLQKRKLLHSQNIILDINREIQELQQTETYSHLRTEESEGIHHQQLKERLKDYISSSRIILKSKLNAQNKIRVIAALAVPVLRYGFGMLN